MVIWSVDAHVRRKVSTQVCCSWSTTHWFCTLGQSAEKMLMVIKSIIELQLFRSCWELRDCGNKLKLQTCLCQVILIVDHVLHKSDALNLWSVAQGYLQQYHLCGKIFYKAIWPSLVSSQKPGSCLAESTISCTEITARSLQGAKRCCLALWLLGSGIWGHGLLPFYLVFDPWWSCDVWLR